jgi:hypothetical protein
MSQYDEIVEKQRALLKAEKWAKNVKSIHAHSFDSMWYDTRGKDGSVLDIEFNSGVIKREIIETGETVFFGNELTGDALLDAHSRS